MSMRPLLAELLQFEIGDRTYVSPYISFCENGHLSEEMQFLLNHLYYYNENSKNIFYLPSLLTAKISFENVKSFQSYCNLKSANELSCHPIYILYIYAY